MSLQIPFYLTADEDYFPNPNLALSEPNGLLAIGGDLSPKRLLAAYRQGIFPWYDNEPILWWSPHPRTVLFLNDIHLSASLKKTIRRHDFEIKLDENFPQVIKECATPQIRQGKMQEETWITPKMQQAYIQLHQLGYAHSLEVYAQDTLIGGIYGIALGKLFFGESMFSKKPSASKIALVYLARQLQSWGYEFIDCQLWSPHLGSMGAITLPRPLFLEKVMQNNQYETTAEKWKLDPGIII
ncbi:MAG: leucyl/phenylalanyl-tRNA--protein transferase [Gammaproteobacteria bacterium]|jgi:leucyl/phenylalanyl-tRNA--protein transferase|nr:leucyl/phenylalanyl-tRNA--protein transferase [Gammaproteobacteria bacterium]